LVTYELLTGTTCLLVLCPVPTSGKDKEYVSIASCLACHQPEAHDERGGGDRSFEHHRPGTVQGHTSPRRGFEHVVRACLGLRAGRALDAQRTLCPRQVDCHRY